MAGDTDLAKWHTESLVSALLISDVFCSETLITGTLSNDASPKLGFSYIQDGWMDGCGAWLLSCALLQAYQFFLQRRAGHHHNARLSHPPLTGRISGCVLLQASLPASPGLL